ncbi:hypothetical protein DM617_28500, partial [Escherichia coli]|nr:hypothetical protein [Escherichia coli]
GCLEIQGASLEISFLLIRGNCNISVNLHTTLTRGSLQRVDSILMLIVKIQIEQSLSVILSIFKWHAVALPNYHEHFDKKSTKPLER